MAVLYFSQFITIIVIQVVAFISEKYLKLQAHNNEAKTGRRNKVASVYFLWKGVQETFRPSETLKDTYTTQTLPGNCIVNNLQYTKLFASIIFLQKDACVASAFEL